MKKQLVKKGFDLSDSISYGNMFLLANGRYGYRGTLEEFTKEQMVGLNVLGFYDRYSTKWRESINLPNPLSFYTYFNDELYDIREKQPLSHALTLDIYNAVLYRDTEYDNFVLHSERFLSSTNKNLLVHRYEIKAKKSGLVEICFKVDLDIFEINGPHFQKMDLKYTNGCFVFNGLTNENKEISTYTKYVSNEQIKVDESNNCHVEKICKENEIVEVFTYSYIDRNNGDLRDNFAFEVEKGYRKLLKEHCNNFSKKWESSRVILDDEEAQFELDYSIYHLLILEDIENYNSIPARGLSGQTYKGAIFWDTEAFMLPYFTLTNPNFARNLLVYRINTLKGAKEKAKGFGYQGAFYAWESQEDGLEQCSKYNVTDPITNEPIRTYFDEKQIHISADVALGFERYCSISGDYSLLLEGGYEVIYECAKFYISRATFRNDKYHFDDVIGPDEYHERINDNAFTNYMAHKTLEIAIKYYDEYSKNIVEKITKEALIDFKDKIYLPTPNINGVIEQFDGYFDLEEAYPKDIKSRAKSDKEYLGFLASTTKTIKQADVVSMFVMLPELALKDYYLTNYNYYLPYTEHGSSLSSSMYSILGSKINDLSLAYKLFRKSSGIDLGTDQKMYAGGIYIGGTHPASNAGAYLSIVFGFAGLSFKDNKIEINPHLPKEINNIEFNICFQKKKYNIKINRESYSIREVKNHD